MHKRFIRHYSRVLRLLVHRPPLPSKQSQHNEQNDSNCDAPVDVIVGLAAEVETGEAVDDAA
jgi:hypothetical protein